MFKMFSTITVFGFLTMPAAFAQSEQSMQARIPFAFAVQHKTMAAGNYQLTYNSTAHVVAIRGLDERSSGVYALVSATGAASGEGKLLFHCVDKSCWLAEVRQADSLGGGGLQLRQTERERKAMFLSRVVAVAVAAK